VAEGRRRVELDSIGSKHNVNIRFENVAKIFGRHLSPRLVDLLEIASYVFSADCAVRRGTQWTDEDSTEPWSRDFAFVIPVRDLAFWGSDDIVSLITEILTFLSNDKYSFTFVPLEHDRSGQQEYLELGGFEDWPFYAPNRVLMFSGGLDSLAGAVETATAGEKSLLVSHRPVSTMSSRQRKLFEELRKEFPGQLVHVPVWINKTEKLGQESTQRTRSFLFSALGTVVAHSINAGGVRFFENGVVSLNLPVADEVLRSRASRTTHPVTLHLLQSLCTAVTGRDLVIDNPYLYKTKTDVVGVLAACGAPHLIAHTCSCAHSMFKSSSQWHCGTCSQCIDRRFAITAAGLQGYDSETDYVSDVFVGPRKDGPEKNMAVDYTRHGIELCRRPESELAMLFNAELSRAVRYEAKRSDSAEKIISIHKRHGEVVARVLEEKVGERAADLINGTLDGTSLLALVIGKRYLEKQNQVSASAGTEGAHSGQFPSGAIPANMEEIFRFLTARIGLPTKKPTKRSRQNPSKRDTVIFAAILMELKGPKYCAFLQDHGIKPKWSDSGPVTSYPKSYQVGHPWRKKVQDEKTRAGTRMNRYGGPQLADAFITYLPDQFEQISPLLRSRNSRNAS
jgi:7-cyano-7-deazaguanine synthase in queuosine biosynthesis